MRHELLTQRALVCIDVMAKRVTLSQHFVTRVVPPLIQYWSTLDKMDAVTCYLRGQFSRGHEIGVNNITLVYCFFLNHKNKSPCEFPSLWLSKGAFFQPGEHKSKKLLSLFFSGHVHLL
jgi:hypothetical protein